MCTFAGSKLTINYTFGVDVFQLVYFTRHLLTFLPLPDGGLQYRDVLIMYANPRGGLHGERKDAFIRLLEEKGIPVQVLPEDATYPQLRDVALATENKVTVSHTQGVSGLERMIVVGMGGKIRSKREDDNRLLAMSRCMSKLIWIGKTSDS